MYFQFERVLQEIQRGNRCQAEYDMSEGGQQKKKKKCTGQKDNFAQKMGADQSERSRTVQWSRLDLSDTATENSPFYSCY